MEFQVICNTSKIESDAGHQSIWPSDHQFRTDLFAAVYPMCFIFRCVTFCVGIPIQLLVAIVILKSRRLHNPRNAFCLGNMKYLLLFLNALDQRLRIFIALFPTQYSPILPTIRTAGRFTLFQSTSDDIAGHR
jgi:hypothetical protein